MEVEGRQWKTPRRGLANFHSISDSASYFTCWDWPEEFSLFLQYLHNVLCVQDKKTPLLIGFNLLYPPFAIICGCPLQVPHYVPLTEFVSSLIPAAVEECCFSPPGWLVLTVRASQWLSGDNQGPPILIWAQNITHLSLPSLSTRLNIVTSLMNNVSLSESYSHILSLSCLSVSLPLPLNMFLHSPAAQPFKGQWF